MPTCFGTTPDYRRLLTVLNGGIPDRVPVYEFFSDTNVQLAAIGDHPMTETLPQCGDEEINRHIRAQYYLGYDYLAPTVDYGFPWTARMESVDSQGNARSFVDDHHPTIFDRASFERCPWPTPEQVDYRTLETFSAHLPEGMGVVCNLGGGLLEWGMWLMGTELFCTMLYDEPELMQEILQRINDQEVIVAAAAASHPQVFAVAMGDDLGFKTQTFLPPHMLREFIFPGLKRTVDAVHAKGKPFILHSCGNVARVMDDLIDEVGIDAKHSFEDVIMPVTEVKQHWGNRVALLGGVDVDFLCRAPEDALRAYIRRYVQICGAGGGFALGSGNSIANYIPPASLRIMLEEAVLCQSARV
ncbi:MAG: uroporphyrinogen decarboxylase family protein [Armatimonadota bacterium]